MGLLGEMVDAGEHSGLVGGYEEAGEWHGLAGLWDGQVGECGGGAGQFPGDAEEYFSVVRACVSTVYMYVIPPVTWSWPALG